MLLHSEPMRHAAYASKNGMVPINTLSGVLIYAAAEERGSLTADRVTMRSALNKDRELVSSLRTSATKGRTRSRSKSTPSGGLRTSVAWQAFNLILTPVQMWFLRDAPEELDQAGFVFISARQPLTAVDILRAR